MSRIAQSPAAQLLRSSRLFSLPTPLPAPSHNVSNTVGYTRGSPTATTPYPTHQAIFTPNSSRARGDWGLKRPLPLKSTNKTSTPVVKISAIDTIEQITEFRSAADHSLSLLKFQEMNLGLSAEPTRASITREPRGNMNVFLDERDYTDPHKAIDPNNPDQKDMRWKRRGPWIAGMTQKDFNIYLNKALKGRRKEFQEFLAVELKPRHLAARKRQARDRNKTFVAAENFDLSPSDMEKEMKRLREDAATTDILHSELCQYITKFLDLPPIKTAVDDQYKNFFTSSGLDETLEQAPQTTHPSAGLSYLRANKYFDNHPILGPQTSHTPVHSRVLRPRYHNQLPGINRAILGVGGFTVEDDISGFTNVRGPTRDHGVAYLDYETEGGRKLWVEPKRAFVDSEGRVVMEVSRAKPEAVAIRNGEMPTMPRSPQRRPTSSSPRVSGRLDDALGFGTESGLSDKDAEAVRNMAKDGGVFL